MQQDDVRELVAKLPSATAKKRLEAELDDVLRHAPAVLQDVSVISKWPAFMGWSTGRTTDPAIGAVLAGMLLNRPSKVWKAAASWLSEDGWAPVPELTSVVESRLAHDQDPKRRLVLVQLVVAGRVPPEDVPGLLELAASDNDAKVSKLASEALAERGIAVTNAWDACPLAPPVVRHLRRLGATFELPQDLTMTLEGHAVPEPIVAFARGVRFPARTYKSPESAAHWVWSCQFNLWGWLAEDEVTIANRNGRPLAYFAHADGGNYILVMSLDSADPTDPWIDRIDHYDPEQRIGLRTKLSRFLASLRPE